MSDSNQVVMVPIKRVVANRYRRGGISEEKVEALMRSYETSGFWDGSIQGRWHPTKRGYVEIAFGHHRVEAAKRKRISEIGIVVSDRSNDDMMRMMADENRAEFKQDAIVARDTIAAVIEAWGKGEIEVEEVPASAPKHTVKEVAPGGATYTITTISRYLGWTKSHGKNRKDEPTLACRIAFDAYHASAVAKQAMETLPQEHRDATSISLLTRAARVARASSEADGLTSSEVRRAERNAAEKMATEIAERGSSVGVRDLASAIGSAAAAEVRDLRQCSRGKPKKSTPPVDLYIRRLTDRCMRADPIGGLNADAARLMPYLDSLPSGPANELAREFELLGERVSKRTKAIATALRSGRAAKIKKAFQLTEGEKRA